MGIPIGFNIVCFLWYELFSLTYTYAQECAHGYSLAL